MTKSHAFSCKLTLGDACLVDIYNNESNFTSRSVLILCIKDNMFYLSDFPIILHVKLKASSISVLTTCKFIFQTLLPEKHLNTYKMYVHTD